MAGLKTEDLNLTEEQKAGSQNLSEEQNEQIARDAGDWDKPPKEEEKGEEKLEEKEEKSEEKSDEKLEEKEDEKKGEKEEEEKNEEEAEEEEKQEEEGPSEEEQKRLDDKAKELDKTIEEVIELEKQEAETKEKERVEAVAKEENISVENVVENEKKDKEIADRHSQDPMKVARALRMQQSEYHKLKNDFDGYKGQVEEKRQIISDKAFFTQLEENKEKIIEEYRDKFEEESSDLSDDVIFERAKAKLKTEYDKVVKEYGETVKTKAEAKRTEFFDGLSEDTKKEFGAEVKEHLAKSTDEQVLDKNYSVDGVAAYVRGLKYTPEYVKKLEEDAFKKGQQNKRIVNKSPKSPKTKGGGNVKTFSLTDDEKQRALDMFQGTNMTENQMFEEYEKNHKGKDF